MKAKTAMVTVFRFALALLLLAHVLGNQLEQWAGINVAEHGRLVLPIVLSVAFLMAAELIDRDDGPVKSTLAVTWVIVSLACVALAWVASGR